MTERSTRIAILAANSSPRTKPTNYPPPFAARVAGRDKRPLGDLFGLQNFGVNLTRLAPGAASSLRHAHSRQDEFVYILSGCPTLVTDEGAALLQPGMCAGFAAGTSSPHHLVNHSDADVVYLEIGDRSPNDSLAQPSRCLSQAQMQASQTFRQMGCAQHRQAPR